MNVVILYYRNKQNQYFIMHNRNELLYNKSRQKKTICSKINWSGYGYIIYGFCYNIMVCIKTRDCYIMADCRKFLFSTAIYYSTKLYILSNMTGMNRKLGTKVVIYSEMMFSIPCRAITIRAYYF